MNEKLHEAIIGTIDTVIEVSRTDDVLRTRLRVIAEELLALTELAEAIESATRDMPEAATVGKASQTTKTNGVVDPAFTDDADTSAEWLDGLGPDKEVEALVDRLTLKAEAARWAAERQLMLSNHADLRLEVAPHDRGFATRAWERNCYLWMLDPRMGRPANPNQYEIIAACYETLAEAVNVAHSFLKRSRMPLVEVEKALTLLAEAQSALRLGVEQCGGYSDEDQVHIFRAVRAIAEERRIYIATGLKLDDPIDPSEWAAIAGSVHALQASFEEHERKERKKAKLLNNLQFKVLAMSSTPIPEPDAWKGLVPVVEDLVALGVQPSRIEIRETLLPVLHLLPAQVEESKEFSVVLREIGKYLENVATPSRLEGTPTAPSAEVKRVASLLAGKSLLLIGGDERPEAQIALERAFGLKNLEWISTSEHESFHNFEPYVAHTDIAAVILLIRWASHSFAELKSVCDRHGKPLVRLPGGYNPNQVAAAILNQASHRLGSPPQ